MEGKGGKKGTGGKGKGEEVKGERQINGRDSP